MHIINDFFLLIWKEDAKRLFSSRGDINSFLQSIQKSNNEAFCDYTSIILIVSESNLDKLKEIKEAREAIQFLSGLNEWDKQRVQFLQKELLCFLNTQGSIKLNKEIQQRLDIFRKGDVIGYEKARKLISLLTLIEEKKETMKPLHVVKAKEGSNFYESAINLFCTSIENLKISVEDKTLRDRLKKIPAKLKNQKFSIGITGVMNAGKSTMLNALLGKEILGTSVIPETANLTLIKYAKKSSAKVNFWNLQEWKMIEKSSDTLENMKPFIKETNEYFKDKLDEYITKDGKSYEISIDELPSFTSAEHSNKKCNLVKSVELYSDLKFIENGVEIVDTPGLDDPVIQREEITKSYVSQCDLMVHLMNVNQSATQKDVEFITDTLLYQNVARLLVVITRIDTVKESELEEVIKYTKLSIKTKLESLNKQNSFDSIIKKIDFIPIAGLQALKHRIGKGDSRYPIEKTGILRVEEYLDEILFGDGSEKANLIIEANKKEIIYIINTAKNSLHVEKSLLGKSASEIKNEYEKYKDEIKDIKEQINILNEKILGEKNELVSYFSTLENFSKNKFSSLQAIVKRRVLDDVSYEIRKNKKKPEKKRISYIIDIALKDGFIDILRDYRYQFSKKIEKSFEKISRDFSGFSQEQNRVSNSKEFFEKHFGDLSLVNSNTVLITKVNNDIKSHSKKDIDGLSILLESHFESALNELYQKFKSKTKKINQELVNQFEQECKVPVQAIEFEMNSKEEILETAQKRVEDKSYDTSARIGDIELKLQVLAKVEGDL